MNHRLVPLPHEHANEHGFTLLELLLVVGVCAMIFVGIATITQSWVNTEVATAGGQYLQRVATVTNNFVGANYAAPLTETDDGLLLAGTDPTWALLKTSLDQEGLLPGGTLHDPLGSDLRIAFKIDNADPTNPIFYTTVYGVTPLPNKKVNEAARQAGNLGGSVTQFRGANAVGAYGQYNLPLTSLTSTPAAFVCTTDISNGCLIAVSSMNLSLLTGSFLYRNDMGDPKYNTMTTDLFMGNHDVTGAKEIDAVNLNSSGTANVGTTNVAGTATFNGPTTAAAGMTVAGAGMTVTGDSSFSNDVNMDHATLNITTLNSNSIEAPAITTNAFNTSNMAVSGGAVTVNDDINVNGNVTSTGQVFASTLNAGVINANGGDMLVGTVNVQNTMNIQGAVNVTGGAVTVDRMVTDHCSKVKWAGGVDALHPDGYAYYGVCP